MKNETARQEIESLDYYLQNHTNDYSEESHTAMMMAIKALEQEPCEDCISQQAVLDLAKKGVLVSNGNYESVCKAINEIPSVNPTKTGHWIDGWVNEYKTCPKVTCSECGIDGTLSYKEYKYCPNCGARMVEQETKINEDISKGFEEFTRIMFKQGQEESEEINANRN